MSELRASEATRSRGIGFSSIRKVFDMANELEASGVDVARMEIGRPDFDTPAHIKQAMKDAVDAGHVHYAPNRGILELRDAVARKLRRENGIETDVDGVVITVGCKEAIFLTLSAYVDAGDEVIVPDPLWDTYSSTVAYLGGVPVALPTRPENAYVPSADDLERRVTPRTKIVVVVSPSNPTGAIYDRATLEGIAAVAQRHGLLVISDEIYEKLVYDGAEHVSIGSLPGMKRHTITINGFSKAYAMDGWRVGYAAGAPDLVRPLVKVHQYTTNCVATFVQWGAIAAYDGPQEPVEAMRQEFDRRRRMLVDRLGSLPGVSLVPPRGAFYAFPRFEGRSEDALALATWMIDEARVACVPGTTFGDSGAGHLRFSYAAAYESIGRGMDRLRAAWLR